MHSPVHSMCLFSITEFCIFFYGTCLICIPFTHFFIFHYTFLGPNGQPHPTKPNQTKPNQTTTNQTVHRNYIHMYTEYPKCYNQSTANVVVSFLSKSIITNNFDNNINININNNNNNNNHHQNHNQLVQLCILYKHDSNHQITKLHL